MLNLSFNARVLLTKLLKLLRRLTVLPAQGRKGRVSRDEVPHGCFLFGEPLQERADALDRRGIVFGHGSLLVPRSRPRAASRTRDYGIIRQIDTSDARPVADTSYVRVW